MEFSTLSSQEQKGKVTFNVCDTGTGFPVEVLDRLQQDLAEDNAKYSTNKHCTGNGLGLPIAIYLVNAMKGKLSVNSIEHVGSVFTVELDVSFIEEHPSEDLGAQKPVKEKNDKDLVLIVDDIELNIKLISAMLRRLNVNFVTTTSGQAALEGAAEIAVFNRKDEFWPRVEQTLQSIAKAAPECSLSLHDLDDGRDLYKTIRRCDILSNATRVGMAPDVERSVITDLSCFRPELVVTDVVYAPPETKLLRDARAAGCRTCDGLGMLLCQGAEAFRLYSGLEMPIEEIRALLYA